MKDKSNTIKFDYSFDPCSDVADMDSESFPSEDECPALQADILKYNEEAKTAHKRKSVFCMGDWLSGSGLERRINLLSLIKRTPNLDWMLFTQQPEHWKLKMELVIKSKLGEEEGRLLAKDWLEKRIPPENICMGTNFSDQQEYDIEATELLKIPAKTRFLICEVTEFVDLKLPVCPICGKIGSTYRGFPNQIGAACEHSIGNRDKCGTVFPKNFKFFSYDDFHPFRGYTEKLKSQCQKHGIPFYYL